MSTKQAKRKSSSPEKDTTSQESKDAPTDSSEDASKESKRTRVSVIDKVAFVGLGAMGYHMAGHLTRWAQTTGGQCVVFNRTASVAEKHSKEHGSIAANTLAELGDAKLIICCLPTSEVVREVFLGLDGHDDKSLGSRLSPGTVVVDCTSGDPSTTKVIGEALGLRGIKLVDAPVSGGPQGAKAGTLTVMMGGNEEAVATAMPAVQSMAKIARRVGPLGAGHTVKAVNNALNVSHLSIAAEGLLALTRAGVTPRAALEVINCSSGRSLQTEVRLPEEVLSRKFSFGFKVGLMQKDVTIAQSVMAANFPSVATEGYFVRTLSLLDEAVNKFGYDADYTTVVKVLEELAGAELSQ